MKKTKKFLSILLAGGMLTTQLAVAHAEEAMVTLYSNDFENVSDDEVTSWNTVYDSQSYSMGQFYKYNTASSGFCITDGKNGNAVASKPHVYGTDDWLYFILPEKVEKDSGNIYKVSYDYYCVGAWGDNLWLGDVGLANMYVQVTDGSVYQDGKLWDHVEITLDTNENTYVVSSSTYPTRTKTGDLPYAARDYMDQIVFRIHRLAATGSQFKIDNLKVEKVDANAFYQITNNDISVVRKDGTVETVTGWYSADTKVGKITVDFKEPIDESTINGATVTLTGGKGVDYTTTYADNKLTLTVNNDNLQTSTTYTMTIDGLKTVSGKDVEAKEFSFTTNSVIVDKDVLYEEDFDDVDDETLSSWSENFANPVTPGMFYFDGTTPALAEHTSETDKCLTIQPHTNGVNDYISFALPEAINENGLYKINFDYYSAGGWCDWFYIRSAQTTQNPYVCMSYAAGNWYKMEMTIDTYNNKWTVQTDSSVYEVPSGNLGDAFSNLPIDTVQFRLHNAAATGTQIKIDNLKVTKITQYKMKTVPDTAFMIIGTDGTIQTDLDTVDNKLDKIIISLDEDADTSSVSNISVRVDGGASYTASADAKMITIAFDEALVNGQDYTVTLNGVKTASGNHLEDRDFTFTVNDKEIVKKLIYSQDFNNIDDDTLNSWSYSYADSPKEGGEWCFNGYKPTLEQREGDDYCIKTHELGESSETVILTLPEALTSDGLGRYVVSFDYYAVGGWGDSFFLGDSANQVTNPIISYATAEGWSNVQMQIDVKNQKWYLNDYLCPVSSLMGDSVSSMTFWAKSLGKTVRYDNFKLYKYVEVEELSSETLTVTGCAFADENNEAISAIPASGTVKANVNLTLNTPGDYNFTAVIAAFKTDGSLQSVATVPVSTTIYDQTKVIEGLAINVDANTDLCQIMIWNMEDGNIIPLTNVIPFRK